MSNQLFSLCQFYLHRCFQRQPAALIAFATSAFVLFCALFFYAQQWRKAEQINASMLLAQQDARQHNRTTKTAPKTEATLPAFNSAQLVNALNQVAANAKLPIDEVLYALDDTSGQPFLRYHVTLSSSATYPTVRRFIDQLLVDQPHVILEAISCSRDDIGATGLNCDLAFSAFYRKADHG